MSIVFLNGSYMPMSEAKISPLDRGFLFGDGIYEVIPSYQGSLLGFGPHIDRMNDGFKGIGLNIDWSHQQWKTVCEDLASKNGNSNLGIYLQVSRGADTKRYHAVLCVDKQWYQRRVLSTPISTLSLRLKAAPKFSLTASHAAIGIISLQKNGLSDSSHNMTRLQRALRRA